MCIRHGHIVVGDDCVIGHMVHLEGCTVEDAALVGNGAVVLHFATIRTGALVGSNAVVTDNTDVPTGFMALGVPAKLREGGDKLARIRDDAWTYVEKCRRYKAELRRID